MVSVTVRDMAGNAVGEMELSERVFDSRVSIPLLHRVVTAYLANRRSGTADTKTRAEVRGGGRKPWRQKGLGRARAGTTRAPQWRHGGVVFGPHPRDYSQRVPQKMRQAAIRQALTAKLRDGELVVVDRLVLPSPKTAGAMQMLKDVAATLNALVVTSERVENVALGCRNIASTEVTTARSLNAYTLLKHERVVLDRKAIAVVEEVFGQ